MKKISLKRRMAVFFLVSVNFYILQAGNFAETHSWQRTNPGGGGAFSTIGAGPTGVIIAGSDLSGAYRSLDDGKSWDVIGVYRGLPVTHVSGVGFDPYNANIIFIGTEDGIYRSDDGGETFVNVYSAGYITDIEVSRSDTSIAYASYRSKYNSSTCRILRSADNGKSWTLVSQDFPTGEPILKIVVDPFNDQVVYALTGKSRFVCGAARIYKSENGGQNWTRLADQLGSIMDIAIDLNNSQILYLSTYNATCTENSWGWTDMDGSLYRSLDAGSDWEKLTDKTGIIFLDPDTAGLMRVLDPREMNSWRDDAGTWTSTDSGHTFTHTGFTDNMDCGYNGIYDPAWATYETYGVSFNGIAQTLGRDLSDSDVILWTNSQFSFRSTDNGTSFKNTFTRAVKPGWWQSTGFDNIDPIDLVIHPTDSNIIYIGAFDIGIWRSLDHGQSWQSCNDKDFTGSWKEYGGNTATIAVDPQHKNVVWATMSRYQKGESPTYLVRSDSMGLQGSWVLSNNGLPTTEVMGLSLDPTSPVANRTLFVTAAGDVYRSTDDGNSWTKVLEKNGLRFTAVDHFDGKIVYAGGGAGFWRSTDGGDNWSEVGLPAMRGDYDFWDSGGKGVFDIHPDPHKSGRVYVTAFGSSKGLWRSENAGVNWEKLWTDDYMRRVAVSPLNEDIIYTTSSSAFTHGGYDSNSNGVLVSKDRGATWTKANEGMAWPFAICVELDTRGYVFVGSSGTGYQKAKVPFLNSINRRDKKKIYDFHLSQNYPNPFNPITIIQFLIKHKERVELVVYDTNGKRIKSLVSNVLSPGTYTVSWNGKSDSGRTTASGIYFYRLSAGSKSQIKRMIYCK